MAIKHPCKICNKAVGVRHKAIQCDACNLWVHIKCNHICKKTYEHLQNNETKWYCIDCNSKNIPFSKLTDPEFEQLNKGKFINSSSQPLHNNIDNKTLNYLNDMVDHSQDNTCKYYDVDGLNELKLKQSLSSYLHLNISSLPYHFQELESLLASINFNFDIIGITESRILTNKQLSTDINLKNYTIEQSPTLSNKGGALLYISDSLKYKPRTDLNISKDKELESIFIEILNAKENNVIVGCIYRHPSMDANEFNTDFLSPLLQKLSYEKKKIILLGDFNIDLLKHESISTVCDFLDQITTNLFKPCIDKPTRITSNSRTLIDNIFTNDISRKTISGNITHSISDHLAQFMVTDTQLEKSYKNKITFQRDFSNFDQENFILDLLGIEWDKHLETDKNDVNLATNAFLHIVNTLLDRYAPLKKLSSNKIKQKLRQKPWITNGITKSIKVRDKHHKKFIKAKNLESKTQHENQFKTYRNRIVQLARLSKTNYYKQYFLSNKKNLKNMWSGIKDIICLKQKNLGSPQCILQNKIMITEPTKIAEIFNKYFSSIAASIEEKIIPTEKSFKEYLTNPNQRSFFLKPSNEKEVDIILLSLSSNKSIGPASIPTKILKLISKIVAIPISTIVNISFSTGEFPTILKQASVSPIHKSGSKLDFSTYRPISLLSNISKIIEKLMCSRLVSFLEQHKCIYESQYGFRAKHSLNHALTQITEKIRLSMDNNSYTCGIFIDLQKAFDTVNHDILLKKLNHYGVRGTPNRWLHSYLSNRKQFVNINGNKSSMQNITHGVPQGSILGPLLFLIYINDLHAAIEHSQVHLFADDTNLLYTNKSLKKLNMHINHDLKLLVVWLRANKISLNVKKTQLIIFRGKNKKINKHLNFRLSGQKLKQCESLKYLGITIDQHLTWKPHLRKLAEKLSRSIGMLSKIRHYVPFSTLHTLYYALFHSHLSFGSQLWGQNMNDQTTRICKLQNKALRTIHFKDRYEPVDPLFSKSKILKLQDLVFSQNCMLVKSFANNTLPSTFKNFFIKTKDVHQQNTTATRNNQYFQQTVNTQYGALSVKNQSVLAWNSLISKLPNINPEDDPLSTVSRHIKMYLLDQYCN